MTDREWVLYRAASQSGRIPPELLSSRPSAHFCPASGGLLVLDYWPNMSLCSCPHVHVHEIARAYWVRAGELLSIVARCVGCRAERQTYIGQTTSTEDPGL